MEILKILAINPGSTSTKVALFKNEEEVFAKTVYHEKEALDAFADVQDQLFYRKETVEQELMALGVDFSSIDIFVGRGGGLVNVEGGVYRVTDRLLEDARKGMAGQHPAQLGAQICNEYARAYGGRAYVVNPPDVDEYQDLARVSGLKGVERQSHVHALNQKEIALRYCAANRLNYPECNLIICHIGGGVSVTAHCLGKMIDGNDIIKGEGPLSPTRAGSLATIDVLNLCFSGEYTKTELKELLTKNGGLISHLGTADARQIVQRIQAKDAYAKLVFEAMLYQIAKNIGSCAAVLKGAVQAIILTGGISHEPLVAEFMREYVEWIAPLVVMAGEFEMEALAAGALRAECGEEGIKEYTGIPVWSSFDAAP